MTHRLCECGSVAGRAGQRGFTLWSLLYVLVTLGLLVLVGVRSVPVYLNAYDIHKVLDWAATRPNLQNAGARDIQNAIQRRFDAGYTTNISGRDIAIKRVPNGRELEARYEQRRPLLFNIDMVYSFDQTSHMNGTGGGP